MSIYRAKTPAILLWALVMVLPWLGSLPGQAKSKEDDGIDAKKVKKIILTTQGGNGHLQAANRIKQDFDKEHIAHKVVDVIDARYMKSAVFNVGKFGAWSWNYFNRKGKVRDMKKLADYQWLAEAWYGHRYFRKIFKLLLKYPNVDEVVDTQPLNTDQILKAIFMYNEISHMPELNHSINRKLKNLISGRWFKGRSSIPLRANSNEVIRYRKVLTDMPTEKAEHFMGSIRKVQPEHVGYLTIETPASPQDDKEASKTKEFFRKTAPQLFALKEHNPIKISPGPIRHGFLRFIRRQASKEVPLTIQVTNKEEYKDLMAAANLEPKQHPLSDKHFELIVGRQARVHSIMLGSQVHGENILAYLESEIELYKEFYYDNQTVYLFIFTGRNNSPDSLFQQVMAKIRAEREAGQLPAQLKIVPLSFQDDQMIGRLYSLADSIMIRAGGLSTMEVEAVSHGYIFIHSAHDKETQDLSQQLIWQGMPAWEGGNALHALSTLRNRDGSRRAYIVNPQLYGKVMRMLHEEGRL